MAKFDVEGIEVTLLNICQCLPSVKALADKGIEVLLKAKTLEMGGEIGHSSAPGLSSIIERDRVVDNVSSGEATISQGDLPRKVYDR